MKKVLFVGEINVDIMMGGLASFPVRDKEITCSSFELTMGSSTAICACAFSSLGGNASFVGLAGNDEYGEFMINGMRDFRINTGHILRTEKVKTGVTVNLIYGDSRTQITYPGTISAFSGKSVDLSVVKQFDHVHIGGPYLQERLVGDVSRILSYAKQEGMTSSLDPQWDADENWQYMDEWLPLLTYFFPNCDEALSITNTNAISDAVSALTKLTACPIVKSGQKGAFYSWDDVVETIPAYLIDVVDTTGAGDSFDAGFLYAVLEKEMNIKDAIKFAIAVAGRSCMFVGGVNASSTYHDIITFMKDHER